MRVEVCDTFEGVNGESGVTIRYTVKPVLRDHYHEKPPVLKDHTFLAEGPKFPILYT